MAVIDAGPVQQVSPTRRALRAAWSLRVTLFYAAGIVAASVALSQFSDSVQDRILLRASTNLHNLLHGHVGTLAASAFFTDGGSVWVWLPGLICLLAVGEILWRSRTLFALFAIGHIGATLLVAVGLFVAVHHGAVPISVVRAEDVGVSYGVAAVVGALTWSLPSTWRAPWAGMWVVVAVTAVAVNHDFTSVGHLVALTLGALVGRAAITPGERPRHIVAMRVLLGIGTVFALAEIGWDQYWWSVPLVAVGAGFLAHHARVRLT